MIHSSHRLKKEGLRCTDWHHTSKTASFNSCRQIEGTKKPFGHSQSRQVIIPMAIAVDSQAPSY